MVRLRTLPVLPCSWLSACTRCRCLPSSLSTPCSARAARRPQGPSMRINIFSWFVKFLAGVVDVKFNAVLFHAKQCAVKISLAVDVLVHQTGKHFAVAVHYSVPVVLSDHKKLSGQRTDARVWRRRND